MSKRSTYLSCPQGVVIHESEIEISEWRFILRKWHWPFSIQWIEKSFEVRNFALLSFGQHLMYLAPQNNNDNNARHGPRAEDVQERYAYIILRCCRIQNKHVPTAARMTPFCACFTEWVIIRRESTNIDKFVHQNEKLCNFPHGLRNEIYMVISSTYGMRSCGQREHTLSCRFNHHT